MLRMRVLPAVLCAALAASSVTIGQSGTQSPGEVPAGRDARDPLTINPVVQQDYLKASNSEKGDEFGGAVSMSGETVVIGASGKDGPTGHRIDTYDGAGAAYVFVPSGTGWSQQAYLKGSNTQLHDLFGTAVSVSGDTLVVGARGEDSNATGVNGDQSNNSAPSSGAAYVFVRSGTTWIQQAYLKASNPDKDDHFGASVSLSGDTLVVGALWEDSNATGVNGDQSDNSASFSGAAYVFVRSGTTWSQQAYLKASNTEAAAGFFNDYFGSSVSVSGDTLVVGAPVEASKSTGVDGDQSDNSALLAGAAYVFVRSGSSWSQQAYLKASNTESGDRFGSAVFVSGDTVMVGAPGEDGSATGVNGDQDDNGASSSGAVYAFVRSGTSWSQQAYLKASNTEADDYFGWSVSVSGDTAMVGAYAEDSNATGSNGDQSDNSASASGATYVFVRSGTSWSQGDYLKASNTESSDSFGASVSVSGDAVTVGAYGEDSNATSVNGDQSDNSLPAAGAAYVIDLGLDAWTHLVSGLAGTSGAPSLIGLGPLSPNTENTLQLTGAYPSSAATLIFGPSQLNAPFKGGTLVPTPLLLVPLLTDRSGSLTLLFRLPPGVPAGTALYFQFWISDPGAGFGLSASNGLEGVST